MPFWAARQLLCVGRLPVGGFLILEIVRAPFFILGVDPPPLKWSDLRYVFDIQEDCNGKEAIQA